MGTLYVVATPIGNLEDVSPRALDVLRTVSVIAAEDTRHSRRLLDRYRIATPLVSYHRHNQRARRERLLGALEHGDVALISDAGTPGISDPGADLVAAALAAGYRVSPIPGPSALAAAVSASGLVEGPFVSLGFLPRQGAARRRAIARAAATGWPIVLFESPFRVGTTLLELQAALGNRGVVLARELSKLHEEVRAGSLGTLTEALAEQPVKGEIVLVVAGAEPETAFDTEAADVLRSLRRSGLSASQAAREAAAITGLPRAVLYELARSVGLEGELALADEDALQYPLRDEEGPQGRETGADEG
jgi:16S rRNA (cytidine1402-2'-O)-methyltransferase